MDNQILQILKENELSVEEFAFICGVQPFSVELAIKESEKIMLNDSFQISQIVETFLGNNVNTNIYYELEGYLFLVKSKLNSDDLRIEMIRDKLNRWQIKTKYNIPASALELLLDYKIDYESRLTDRHPQFMNFKIFFD